MRRPLRRSLLYFPNYQIVKKLCPYLFLLARYLPLKCVKKLWLIWVWLTRKIILYFLFLSQKLIFGHNMWQTYQRNIEILLYVKTKWLKATLWKICGKLSKNELSVIKLSIWDTKYLQTFWIPSIWLTIELFI